MASIRFVEGVPYYVDDTGTSRQFLWTSASATWNPANLTAGTQTTTTLLVTGAALGDPVVPSFSLDNQGLQLTGYVSSADIVTVVLRNGTAGAVNLGSGTLRVLVGTFV